MSDDQATLLLLRRLALAAEYRDPQTAAHMDRVSRYAGLLAQRAGIERPKLHLIQLAAMAHDVGKFAVPEGILWKPGSLTSSERLVINDHSIAGHKLLRGIGDELTDMAASIACSHHERWDGSGYPKGLAGEDIPVEGRVTSIVDAWDAMSTDRAYRRALWKPQARGQIRDGSGTHFDPGLARVWLDLIDSNIV